MGLDSMMWRLKQWFRKVLPIALIGAVCYGGYNMYRAGALRHGVGPAFNYVVRSIPFFGSKFGHYRGRSGSVAQGRSYRGRSSAKAHRKSRSHRRHYRRR